MPADNPTVPCAQCLVPIDARRAALPISHGRCVDCNAPFLLDSRAVREHLPQPETLSAERRTQHTKDLRAIWRDDRGVAP